MGFGYGLRALPTCGGLYTYWYLCECAMRRSRRRSRRVARRRWPRLRRRRSRPLSHRHSEGVAPVLQASPVSDKEGESPTSLLQAVGVASATSQSTSSSARSGLWMSTRSPLSS